jgi:hypothetical protein
VNPIQNISDSYVLDLYQFINQIIRASIINISVISFKWLVYWGVLWGHFYSLKSNQLGYFYFLVSSPLSSLVGQCMVERVFLLVFLIQSIIKYILIDIYQMFLIVFSVYLQVLYMSYLLKLRITTTKYPETLYCQMICCFNS